MHVSTMLFVIIGWVLFRSKDVRSALLFIRKMFAFNELSEISFLENYYIKNGGIMLIIGLICVFPVISSMKKLSCAVEAKLKKSEWLANSYRAAADIVCALMILAAFTASVLICIKSTYNPFIYFNF